MQMPMCSRCKKNIAVVFISSNENNGVTKNEAVCLKCAHDMGLKPIDGLMQSIGMNADEVNEMLNQLQNSDNLEDLVPAGLFPEVNDGSTPFLENLFSELMPTLNAQDAFNNDEQQNEAHTSESSHTKYTRKNKNDKKRKHLKSYCTDLTNKARKGHIDNIVGRDEEIRRVIQILNRRQKNNPCLIGEPGVGKTAVGEGLAVKIVNGDVPYKLQDKEVFLLDLTSLVAGTQFRGQFEGRVKGLIEEVKEAGNIILFIDEVHNLVGVGDGSEGAMNAANILKPALSRGEIQVIGATTFKEYRKHIEKDSALERRFQPVTILEPSVDECVEILKGIRSYYELYHTVSISEDMCRKAVLLSERYITDRFLPDKAIDLIDEACSEINLENTALTQKIQIERQLSDIQMREDELMQEEIRDYEALASLKSKEIALSNQLYSINSLAVPELTTEHLANVIELWTKIPASKICQKESIRLLELDKRLKERIIGQGEAIDSISMAIRRSRAGVSPKKKPISFIFVGPTGVGKTELVRCLSEDLFDTPDCLIRFDMSEFMEKHAVSRLVGSPPGYVGYDEAGQLTEKIRRKPHSVVLFDEIEKAHPDVLNILLQVLDDGHITDAQGRKVSFENTIIVMTSNAGSDRNDAAVGFGSSLSQIGKDKAIKALSSFLRPEFLNRVDEVIAFNQLTQENFEYIADIMMDELCTNLKEQNVYLEYDKTLLSYLASKSYSIKFGARNLRRTIQKEVEDLIAIKIIEYSEQGNIHIKFNVKDDKIIFDYVAE